MNAYPKLKFTCLLLATILVASCSKSLFTPKPNDPHDLYKDGLVKAGLHDSRMGAQWITLSQNCLLQPVKIEIPFKETGYFAADKPLAKGYIFMLRRGDRVKITITSNPASGIKIFGDLWTPALVSVNDDPLAVMDTTSRTLLFNANEEANFILRIQPELLAAMEYTLTIITEPSLGFPVQQSGKPKIISLWGAGRDNNARKHEGIDIGATFRTPALAVADGYITRVGENNLGGKVVFMRPQGQDYSVYYAHLDEQTVQQGQTVKAGEPIGLVGNTGNAKFTAPHLHFGIYTGSGAIDPLAFVDNTRPKPKGVAGSAIHFDKWLRTRKDAVVYASPLSAQEMLKLKPGDIVRVQSANANWYQVVMPDGREGFINHEMLVTAPLRKQKIKVAKNLLDSPVANAPVITSIAANNEVEVKGMFNGFMMVRYKDTEGWLLPGDQ